MFDVRGCAYFGFSEIYVSRDFTNASYTIVRALFHCDNEALLDETNDGLWQNYMFYNKSKCLNIWFLDKTGNRNRIEPEPRKEPEPDRMEPTETEPNRTIFCK